jgi:uncharacterized protein YegP (UPF0339 family)
VSRSIFVSYADRDRVLVDHALRYLRQRGLVTPQDHVVIDRDAFTAGTDLRKATQKAIDGADAVLVIWTPTAETSKWVNYELGMADALGKDVIAIAVHGNAADLPSGLHAKYVFEMPVPEAGVYELNRNTRGEYSFTLKNPNNEIALQSELYVSKASALNGIASVQLNSALDSRYVEKKTSDGRFYFILKAANGQVIGTSPLYISAAACDAGLRSVRANGALAKLKDNT